MQHIDMKMQPIELRSESSHFFEHHDVSGFGSRTLRSSRGDLAARLKPGGREKVATRK